MTYFILRRGENIDLDLFSDLSTRSVQVSSHDSSDGSPGSECGLQMKFWQAKGETSEGTRHRTRFDSSLNYSKFHPWPDRETRWEKHVRRPWRVEDLNWHSQQNTQAWIVDLVCPVFLQD